MPTEVFLDTTIPVSDTKGPRFRELIASFLSEFRFRGISSYSKLEYGNLMLSTACLTLRKINEFGSLRQTQEWFANCSPPQKGSWKTWGFNLLVGHYGSDDAECTERARLALQALLRYGTRRVTNFVDHVEDGTKCVWATRGVIETKKGLRWETPNCRKDKPRCRIVPFFENNRKTFQRIQERISRMTKKDKTDELSDFEELIKAASNDPSMLWDYRNCKRLADAIIAVDSRDWGHFFTQNLAESIVLCEVLGQHLHYMSSNFTKPIVDRDFTTTAQ